MHPSIHSFIYVFLNVFSVFFCFVLFFHRCPDYISFRPLHVATTLTVNTFFDKRAKNVYLKWLGGNVKLRSRSYLDWGQELFALEHPSATVISARVHSFKSRTRFWLKTFYVNTQNLHRMTRHSYRCVVIVIFSL